MKYLVFLAIALLVALPWFFDPGYLLLLDWQIYPQLPPLRLDTTGGISSTPIQLILHGIALLTSTAHAQKVLILLILASAGYTTMLLAKTISSQKDSPLIWYAAGIFAMLNPFVYNRIHMGHVYLLAAYAVTPLALMFMIRFVRKPSVRTALYASLICSLVIAINIHHIILLPLILALFFWNERNKAHLSLQTYAALTIPFLSTLALILFVTATNSTSTFHTLQKSDFLLFAPVAQCSKSVLVDSLILAAQWRNPIATNAPCTSPIFFVGAILLTCIMGIGAMRNKRLLIGAIVFLTLAIIPIFPPMRDSAKFLANLAIIESILLVLSIESFPKTQRKIASWVALILVCIVGFPMLWGLSHTIVPQEYPASWYKWDKQLASMQTKPTVLFLPWHLYLPFDFTNQRATSNPAVDFFTHANIIQGDNVEIQQGATMVTTQSNRSVSHAVEDTLSSIHTDSFRDRLRTLLTQEHMQYIALSHGSPEEDMYRQILESLPYLELRFDEPGLTVWEFLESPETLSESYARP